MRMMKATLVLLSALLVSGMARAETGAAERLTQLLEPLKTYSADFDQQVVDSSGAGSLQNAKGHMWLSRPGKFRWEVSDPYRQTVVSDGAQVYLYDPDLEQVTIRPLDQRVTHTPALLLSGQASELTANYGVSRRQQGTSEIFTLSPKAPDTLFEELEMTFNSERLAGLELTDSTGQRTAITFRKVENNPSIDADRFEFHIPSGADVIREGQ